jgi:anti-sigma factor RsiW
MAQHEMYAADDAAGQRLARGPAVPATWPDRTITLGLSAPDLRALEFELIGRRQASLDGQDGVQLLYRDRDRRFLSLFLHPRRATAQPAPAGRDAGSLLAYRWVEGPLAVIATAEPGRMPPGPLLERVREAVAQARILDLPRGSGAIQADGQSPGEASQAAPSGLDNGPLQELPLQPTWTN